MYKIGDKVVLVKPYGFHDEELYTEFFVDEFDGSGRITGFNVDYWYTPSQVVSCNVFHSKLYKALK